MALWGSTLTESRKGVMLHYDASVSDKSSVEWLHSPKCKVSYNLLVLDSGAVERIAPDEARAYHAGVCRPSDTRLAYKDANSAFYGVSIAATDGDKATAKQFAAVVRVTVGYFLKHGWGAEETWRIVGHETEAWPRGRKHDPTGSHKETPVLDVDEVRLAVRRTILESAL